MAANYRGSNAYGAFPELRIDQNDVTGSWRKFADEFMIAIELQEMDLGAQGYANPRARLLALIKAVGQEGRDFFTSVGFDMRQGSFDRAFTLLDEHYAREENMFIKTHKFFSVSQHAGEDDRDYLVRVERLSRDADFANADAVRRRFALVLAVNGLRDAALRLELMAKRDLDWESLGNVLKARSVARHAANVLASDASIKQEVNEVRRRTYSRSSSLQSSTARDLNSGGHHNSSSRPDRYEGRSEHDRYASDRYNRSSRSVSRERSERGYPGSRSPSRRSVDGYYQSSMSPSRRSEDSYYDNYQGRKSPTRRSGDYYHSDRSPSRRSEDSYYSRGSPGRTSNVRRENNSPRRRGTSKLVFVLVHRTSKIVVMVKGETRLVMCVVD